MSDHEKQLFLRIKRPILQTNQDKKKLKTKTMKFIFERFSREGLENLFTPKEMQTDVNATVEQLLVDAMNEITVLKKELEDFKAEL